MPDLADPRARVGPCLVSHPRRGEATVGPSRDCPWECGRVTPRQVPLLQELPLLGTSGHICTANPSTSSPVRYRNDPKFIRSLSS